MTAKINVYLAKVPELHKIEALKGAACGTNYLLTFVETEKLMTDFC
jgi:hypothetical protein